ncbi:hypothetical protein [Halostagnicola kamekurae]|uniref:Uncharacterized protein n=1 Tax=Halostagnicola kamekurae TaxID=619731 RepID=A0A1I6USD9_9EURY|nr:hypothetical protein [Halostagnicola kamekurae]SFT04371.1 hypothetical protein SAMN04488556_4047 [Halostagnicola kamekurae]
MGDSTAEADVFAPLVEWLDDQGYEFFIHVPGSHRSIDGYARLYERYPSHSITIGPYKPDVVGFTPANRVFAIEVKGTENLRKGLGQALSYQRGVDHAYLAADNSVLTRVQDIAVSKGIGTLGVNPRTSSISQEFPSSAEMKDLLYNTRHQLENMLVTANERSRRLPNYADPLNQLMPVVAIASHDQTTEEAIGDLCEDESYPYRSAYKRMIRLAEYLGMIRLKSGEYQLTEQGMMGETVLRGYDVETISDLKVLKGSGQLWKKHPPIATYLRNRFASNPDFRTLFEVLLRHGDGGISIQELCGTLIDNYPSTFLNLVYTDHEDDEGPTLIEQGRGHEIYNDPEYLKRIVHSQFISNTASQFKSLGVLESDSPVIEPKSALNPTTNYWYPRGFQLK